MPTNDTTHLPTLLTEAFGFPRSEARRLIAQGAVRIDGQVVGELDVETARILGRELSCGNTVRTVVA